MVQYSANAHAATRHSRLDAVFGALSDPTRRTVLARLEERDHSIGELAEPFAISLTGFIKHLRILEDAGLITRHKNGRVVSVRLRAGALAGAREWLERHEAFWRTRLDRLDAFLTQKEHSWPSQSTKTPSSSSVGPSTPPPPRSTPRGRTRRK